MRGFIGSLVIFQQFRFPHPLKPSRQKAVSVNLIRLHWLFILVGINGFTNCQNFALQSSIL